MDPVQWTQSSGPVHFKGGKLNFNQLIQLFSPLPSPKKLVTEIDNHHQMAIQLLGAILGPLGGSGTL